MVEKILQLTAIVLYGIAFFALAKLVIIVHYNLHKLISRPRTISGRILETSVEKILSGAGAVGRGSNAVSVFSHYFNSLEINTIDGEFITICESVNQDIEKTYCGQYSENDRVELTIRKYRGEVYMLEPVFEEFFRIKG